MAITTIFLILAMVILFSLQSLFSRLQASAYPGEQSISSVVFSFWYGLLIAAMTCIGGGYNFHPSAATVMLGTLNALMVLGYNISLIGASDRGDYSITIIFMIFGGILIPLIVSVLFMGDTITPIQLLAILGMLVVFFIMNSNTAETNAAERKNGRTFWILCVLLLVFNGLYGVIMDVQQDITAGSESKEMVMITYFMLALFSFVFLLFRSKGNIVGAGKMLAQTKKSFLFLILAGAVGTFAQNLVLYLLGLVPSGILYTFDNGGTMLISVLYSVVIFKENLTKKRIVAILLALLFLVILSVC